MSTDDLNQRVEARLAELERYSSQGMDPRTGRAPSDPIGRLIWINSVTTLPLVASWRERWERHSTEQTRAGGGLPWCAQCQAWGCADQQAICREIGVQP